MASRHGVTYPPGLTCYPSARSVHPPAPSPETQSEQTDRFRNRKVEVFLHENGGSTVSQREVRADDLAHLWELERIRKVVRGIGGKPEFLITTLPNPAAPIYARRFDVLLSAMRRAADREDYIFATHDFPWESETSRASASEGKSSVGWMLFDSTEKESLFVLVVPEMAASGVDETALRTALAVADSFQSAAEKPLNILGPTFSGSASSMRAALATWGQRRGCTHAKPCYFTISSGTASNKGVRVTLGNAEDQSKEGIKIKFSAEAVFDEDLQDKLESVILPSLGIQRKETVILQESSRYGSSYSPGLSDSTGFKTIPFPMNISSLRTAYEQASQGARSHEPSMLDQVFRTDVRLSLSLGESLENSDAIWTASPLLTPATGELLIRRIIGSDISTQRVKAVGIVATNVNDKIFLAEQIHRYAPDVRLFTMEADELITHPSLHTALSGMVIVSSHSMVETGDRGSVPIRFASSEAHGVFKATRELLSGRGKGGKKKKIYVTAVGRDQLVLLDVRGLAGPAENVELEPLGNLRISEAWWSIGILLILAIAYGTVQTGRKGNRLDRADR